MGEERLKEEMDEINARAWFAKYRYFSPKFMQIVEELSDEMVRLSQKTLTSGFRSSCSSHEKLPVVGRRAVHECERVRRGGLGGNSNQTASRYAK